MAVHTHGPARYTSCPRRQLTLSMACILRFYTGVPAYSAEQYAADCGALPIAKTVHIEAMASDGAAEAAYASTPSAPSAPSAPPHPPHL